MIWIDIPHECLTSLSPSRYIATSTITARPLKPDPFPSADKRTQRLHHTQRITPTRSIRKFPIHHPIRKQQHLNHPRDIPRAAKPLFYNNNIKPPPAKIHSTSTI